MDSIIGCSALTFCLLRHCGSRTAGEVLFCYSPKEYPEKAATTATPRKKHGVPIESAHLPCREKTRKKRSDSFHGKLMADALSQWLAEVDLKSKTYTADTLEIVPYYGTI